MRRFTFGLIACGLLGLAPAPASAQAPDWASTIIAQRSFDFGTVARGSKVRHTFKLVNTTPQSIHIATWQTKCGCTEVRVGSQDVPPGTQTTVEAVIDTTKFEGYKASGLTLVIDKPTFANIDLNLTCFIRGDLTLNPGLVDFGVVTRTSKPMVALNLTYAGGQPDWAITKMETIDSHVTAKLQEVGRSPGGQVQYVLSATLNPSVPGGFFKDAITLHTNDPKSPTIPVSVVANVQSSVVVSPSVINLGQVKPGTEVKKTLIVRSSQPFKLTDLKSTRPELTTVTAAIADDKPKTLHTVVVSFKAPAELGPFSAWFEIGTDLKDETPTKLTAYAVVTP
ncbi:DUF1573 domain-containing protein [Isosphaeraceae bacterium EP7]